MRRDFDPGGKSDRGHTQPEELSPEKQNHHADDNAKNWNREIHCPVVAAFLFCCHSERSRGIERAGRATWTVMLRESRETSEFNLLLFQKYLEMCRLRST